MKNTIILITISTILLTLFVIPVWPQPNGSRLSILERLLRLENKVRVLEEKHVGLHGWVSPTVVLPVKKPVRVQHVTLPHKGTYLIISNFRIRVDGDNPGYFVKSNLSWANQSSECRMIVEGIACTKATNPKIINHGGSVAWVINVTDDNTTISAYYTRELGELGNGAQKVSWFNGANGVSRLIAVRIN